MRKYLSIIIVSLLFVFSCNNNDDNSTSQGDIATRNIESVEEFLKALSQKDKAQLDVLYAENSRHNNVYHSGVFPQEAIGKPAVVDYWDNAFNNFGESNYPIDRIMAMEDPNHVFVQFKGEIQRLDVNETYENQYFATFEFDNEGRIIEFVEIFNPIEAARAFNLWDVLRNADSGTYPAYTGTTSAQGNEIAERNKNNVRAFLNALSDKDKSVLSDLYADNGRHINVYHSDVFPQEASGKPAVVDYWDNAFNNFGESNYPIDRIMASQDSRYVFVQFKGEIQRLDINEIYQNQYYAIFEFNNEGEILEFVEIFNPIEAARAFNLWQVLQ